MPNLTLDVSPDNINSLTANDFKNASTIAWCGGGIESEKKFNKLLSMLKNSTSATTLTLSNETLNAATLNLMAATFKQNNAISTLIIESDVEPNAKAFGDLIKTNYSLKKLTLSAAMFEAEMIEFFTDLKDNKGLKSFELELPSDMSAPLMESLCASMHKNRSIQALTLSIEPEDISKDFVKQSIQQLQQLPRIKTFTLNNNTLPQLFTELNTALNKIETELAELSTLQENLNFYEENSYSDTLYNRQQCFKSIANNLNSINKTLQLAHTAIADHRLANAISELSTLLNHCNNLTNRAYTEERRAVAGRRELTRETVESGPFGQIYYSSEEDEAPPQLNPNLPHPEEELEIQSRSYYQQHPHGPISSYKNTVEKEGKTYKSALQSLTLNTLQTLIHLFSIKPEVGTAKSLIAMLEKNKTAHSLNDLSSHVTSALTKKGLITKIMNHLPTLSINQQSTGLKFISLLTNQHNDYHKIMQPPILTSPSTLFAATSTTPSTSLENNGPTP